MAGVNIKMGVDVSQFKQGMQQAQQSAKTFQAQLKANEAQFKATGDKEQYLTEKGKLLKKELEAQKAAVANAQKALDAMSKEVDKNSAEYQKMERALAQAQAAMYDTQAAMNSMAVSEEKANKGANDLSNSLSGIGKKVSFDAVINGIDRITGGLEKEAGKVIDIGQGIWDEMMKSAQWADDTATMALMYEVPLQELLQIQALVANGLDTTVDAILGAQVKMRKGVGNGSIADELEAIGVSMERVVGQGKYGPVKEMRDSVDLFWEAGQAIMSLGDEYDKEEKAQKIFGKSWRELIPLFTEYHSYDEFAAAMGETYTLTDDEVNKLTEMNDAVSKLQNDFKTLENKVMAGLAPALTKASEVLSGLLENVLKYLDSPEGQQALKDMETAVSGLFEDLSKIEPDKVVEGFMGVFDKIVGGLQWLDTNHELVEGLLVGIVTAWGAAKLAGGALTVLELVNGLITLKNTKSIKIPDLQGDGGTGGGSGGQQTVTQEDVANQSVQNAAITTATFTNGTFTSVNTATENVTTMYVQNMIGGNGSNPTTPTNPTIPTTGGGGGLPTGYTPYLLPTGNGSSGVNLGSPAQQLLGSGNSEVVVNSGGGDIYLSGKSSWVPVGKGDARPMADISIGPDTVMFDSGSTGAGFVFWDAFDKISQSRKEMAYVDPNNPYNYSYDPVEGWDYKEHVKAGSNETIQLTQTLGNFVLDEMGKSRLTKKLLPVALSELGKSFEKTASDAWGGIKWFGEGMAESVVNLFAHAIPALVHGTDINGNYDQKRTWAQMFGEDIPIIQAIGSAVESVKGDWTDFTSEVNNFIDNVPDIVLTLKLNMDKSSDRWGFDPSWFNQPGSAFTPVQAERLFYPHANGLFSVPWDGYPALLHKGERVLTAREADRYTYNNYFGNVNLNNGLEIEALTESIERRNRRQRSGYGA